jgi:hypothetical protein
MNKRNLLLVGAGVAIGYLLVGIMKKNKEASGATTDTASLPDTSSQTVPPSTKGDLQINNSLSDITRELPPLTQGKV